jgi:hypothetical protein
LITASQQSARTEAAGIIRAIRAKGRESGKFNVAWVAGRLGVSVRGVEAIQREDWQVDALLLTRLRGLSGVIGRGVIE